MNLARNHSADLADIMRMERRAFAAKIRMVRAVLNWSQSEFAFRIGLTQRAVHKLEQGETAPRRATVFVIEEVWREQGILFEDLGDGGFRVLVRAAVLERPISAESRRRHAAHAHLGVTARAPQ